MVRRRPVAVWVVGALAPVLLSACSGSGAENPGAAEPGRQPTPTTSDSTGGAQGAPPPPPLATPLGVPPTSAGAADLADLRERCLAQTAELDRAVLRFDNPVDLDLSEAERFTVTLSMVGSPGPAGAGPVQGQLGLACTVQARLVGSHEELDVNPDDWVEVKYVLPRPVSWSWVVTARVHGTSRAVLQLKPVIRVTQADGTIVMQDLRIEEYPVAFRAGRSAGDWVAASWTWLVGLAGGAGAALGLLVTWRSLRRRHDTAPVPTPARLLVPRPVRRHPPQRRP